MIAAAASLASIATRSEASAAAEKAWRRRGSTAGAEKRKASGKAGVAAGALMDFSIHENVFGAGASAD